MLKKPFERNASVFRGGKPEVKRTDVASVSQRPEFKKPSLLLPFKQTDRLPTMQLVLRGCAVGLTSENLQA